MGAEVRTPAHRHRFKGGVLGRALFRATTKKEPPHLISRSFGYHGTVLSMSVDVVRSFYRWEVTQILIRRRRLSFLLAASWLSASCRRRAAMTNYAVASLTKAQREKGSNRNIPIYRRNFILAPTSRNQLPRASREQTPSRYFI